MHKVMVLAGGPDRERDVSLMSGAEVTEALRQAGHVVRQRDIDPSDHGALEAFESWGGDVIFPVMHGGWGEGGAMQAILEDRGLPFVGCRAAAARLAMDKHLAKLTMQKHGLPTPPHELLLRGQRRTLEPPLVLKPPCEGSSIDTVICRDHREATAARSRLARRHSALLAERYIAGLELTVGTLEVRDGLMALPTIQIVTTTAFYDYDAKYVRDDTRYPFDIDLPAQVLADVRDLALKTHQVLGCRHLGRVDFIVDEDHRPWILELNTIPGFTTHSLLPMAAAKAGIPMPRLVDHLVRLTADGPDSAPLTSASVAENAPAGAVSLTG